MKTRDVALDAMRGMAILFMIELHALIHVRPASANAYDLLRSVGVLAAPFFLLCAGMGSGLMHQRYQSTARQELRSIHFRRGAFLIGFASLLGLAHFELSAVFDWDIFTLIGTLYLLLGLVPTIRWWIVGAAAGGVAVTSVLLPTNQPVFLRGGSFPIVPFATYFGIGFAYAYCCPAGQNRRSKFTIGAIAGLALIGAVVWRWPHFTYLNRFDAWSLGGILAFATLFLLLLLCMREVTRLSISSRFILTLADLGVLSFSLYYIQYGVLILVPIGAQALTGFVIHVVVPTWLWLLLMLSLYLVLYVVVRLWRRLGYKFSLEWFMHRYVSPHKGLFEATHA